jgi:hypothetical protein
MKKISIIYIACGLLFSCKKQLDVYPTTQEVSGNVIVDAKSARSVLSGVYYRFADAGADNNGVPSTLWVDPKEGYASELSGLFNYGYGGSTDLTSHTYKPTSSEALMMWTYGYDIVNAANGFLENVAPVSTIPDSTKNEMIGEALFLRAYANAYLLLNFGQYYDTTSTYGIILRTKFVTSTAIAQPRVSVAAAYDSILADLNNAIPSLASVNTSPAWTNAWAAKLLKARLLINRSSGDYPEVVSLTSDIIRNSPFSLEANVEDVFRTNGLSSNEVLLGVQPYTSPQQTYKFNDYLYYYQYVLTDSAVSLFNGDPRRPWMYYMGDFSAYGFGQQGVFTKYYPGDTTNPVASAITENSYAFRLTEAYLLEAEALAGEGGDLTQAKSLLKTVMGHAGYTDFSAVDAQTTPDGLQNLIIREEIKNFMGEDGQDWLAERRWPFATLQAWAPSITTRDLLILPIPQSEIQSNGLIQQNPGY